MRRRTFLTLAVLVSLSASLGLLTALIRKGPSEEWKFKISEVASDLEVPWSIAPLGGGGI
ncbi:hypothetical protein [Pyrobaculum aerophilum]|uniref:hypothetical protein n=1 Tax=Pyrobaculum aerophilum TaxID=13773 RepID=UPI002162903C|nr:hypothetical protein [Pyrobaculum aerophilum]